MTLRRTALKRTAELKRTGELKRTPLARARALRTRQVKASSRPRDTGPTASTRMLVTLRAGGSCEYCGRTLLSADGAWMGAYSIHHRQPRGMGGTSRGEANTPANLLLLCGTGTTGCHGYLERHRHLAEQDGWIVRHGLDPADVPVAIWRGSSDTTGVAQVFLTVTGQYAEVTR